jgi:NADH-quinone oxidoreductase subunit H
MINMTLHPFILQLGLILLKIVCLLVTIAYYTIAERKIMAAIQRRRGPNVVGFWGLLQPLADGLKLIAKEMVIPSHANSRVFVLAPIGILTLSLVSWSILPFSCKDYSEKASIGESLRALYANLSTTPHLSDTTHILLELDQISNIQYSLLIILAISSLSVYSLIIAGWASNSKYAFLGSLRSAAQIISYEVSISLVVLPVIFLAGSLNFTNIIETQRITTLFLLPLLPLSIIFFIAIIAETNRTPFDLPEAEAELVAGYNIEYSSIIFAMSFLGEYGNMALIAHIKTHLFWGGWTVFPEKFAAVTVALIALIFCFLFVLVRATFPRYRYDQLIDIGWKIFLPLATGLLLLVVGIVIAFKSLPVVNELSELSFILFVTPGARANNFIGQTHVTLSFWGLVTSDSFNLLVLIFMSSLVFGFLLALHYKKEIWPVCFFSWIPWSSKKPPKPQEEPCILDCEKLRKNFKGYKPSKPLKCGCPNIKECYWDKKLEPDESMFN